ncbi:MAG: DUF484 family protein [Burkholderiaceae bacterium]
MTDDLIDADRVARYLRDHPEFFDQHEHAELLATITLPHPHGGRAISLQERQLEVLRERHRALEMRLAELLRIGEENDAIGNTLHGWTRSLLLNTDPGRLPALVADGIGEAFSVPQVAMRLWGLHDDWAQLPGTEPVPSDVISLANSMVQPFCGPNSDFQAATWLPGGGSQARSIALLPLRKGADPNAFGLLVLGSPDGDRFRSGLGTAYLERIAELASAALARLVG